MKSAQRSPTMIAGALVFAWGSSAARTHRRPEGALAPHPQLRVEHAVRRSAHRRTSAGCPVVAHVARTQAVISSSVDTAGPGWTSAATADANGSVATISRVRRMASTNAATSAGAVAVFSWIAGGTAASAERTITLPRLCGVQYDCRIDNAAVDSPARRSVT